MTFVPHFKHDSAKNIMFADIAGLNDTSGILVDTVNTLLNRIIFKFAKQIKIIIAFQYQAVLNSRGTEIRSLLRQVQKMILAQPLEIIECVQPVITRSPVNLGEQSVDDLRDTIVEQMTQAMNV